MNGNITLNAVSAMRNGGSCLGDGIFLGTEMHTVTIKNCTSIGNWGPGIEIWMQEPDWLTIRNASYMGNDVDNSGDANLVVIDL